MNTLKTRVVIICLLFMLAFIPVAQATVTYPDNPIAGCVGFPDWWWSEEIMPGVKAMIYFVKQCLGDAGYSCADVLNIAAGYYPDLILP